MDSGGMPVLIPREERYERLETAPETGKLHLSRPVEVRPPDHSPEQRAARPRPELDVNDMSLRSDFVESDCVVREDQGEHAAWRYGLQCDSNLMR